MKSENKQCFQQSVGRHLKECRQNAGLTQSQVTQVLGFTSPQHLSNIERGTSPASIELIKELMVMYKVPPKKMVAALSELYKSYLDRELLYSGDRSNTGSSNSSVHSQF